MDDELDELVQECLVSSNLHHVNVLAATGACAPCEEPQMDELMEEARRAPDELQWCMNMLEEGAASAVPDVERFYALGLPLGSPGGLAALCISQPEEVLERVAVVRSLLVLRDEARDRAKAGVAHRQQGNSRKAGRFDRPRYGRHRQPPTDEGGEMATEQQAAVADGDAAADDDDDDDDAEEDGEEAMDGEGGGQVVEEEELPPPLELPSYRPRVSRSGIMVEEQEYADAGVNILHSTKSDVESTVRTQECNRYLALAIGS